MVYSAPVFKQPSTYVWPTITGLGTAGLYVLFANLFFGLPSQTVQAGASEPGSMVLLGIACFCLGFLAALKMFIQSDLYWFVVGLCVAIFSVLMIIQGVASIDNGNSAYGTAGWLTVVLLFFLVCLIVVFLIGIRDSSIPILPPAVPVVIVIAALSFWCMIIISSSSSSNGSTVTTNHITTTTLTSTFILSNTINPIPSSLSLFSASALDEDDDNNMYHLDMISATATPPSSSSLLLSKESATKTVTVNSAIGDIERFDLIRSSLLNSLTLTDSIAVLSNGSMTNTRFIQSATFTDGVGTISNGALTGFSIAGIGLTDGTITMANGSLTNAVFLSSSTVTDGVMSMKQGSLTDVVLLLAESGGFESAIAGSFSDLTTTMTNGSLTSALFIESSNMESDNLQVTALDYCPLLWGILRVTRTDVVCSSLFFPLGTCGDQATFPLTMTTSEKLAWAASCGEAWEYNNTLLTNGYMNNLITTYALRNGAEYIYSTTLTDKYMTMSHGSLTSAQLIETAIVASDTITDLTTVMHSGSITNAVFVSAATFTDGVSSSMHGGSLTSALFMNAATMTDGVATLNRGSLTKSALVAAATISDGTSVLKHGTLAAFSVLAYTISDGTGVMRSGSLTNLYLQTALQIQTNTLTDGVASLNRGSLTRSALVVAGTISDGTGVMRHGSLYNMNSVSATFILGEAGGFNQDCVSALFTDVTATLHAGSLTSAKFVSSTTLTDTHAFLHGGSLTSVTYASSDTWTDNNLSMTGGSLTGLNNFATNMQSQSISATITALKPITTLNSAYSGISAFYLSDDIPGSEGSIWYLVNLSGGTTVQIKCSDETTVLCTISYSSGATLVKVSGTGHCSYACF